MLKSFGWVFVVLIFIGSGFYLNGFIGVVLGSILSALVAGFLENIRYTIQTSKKTSLTIR